MISFEGKTAVVTGSGRGLGRIYAIELSKRGAKVVINDYSPDTSKPSPADEVVKEIVASGGIAVANYDNIATEKGGAALIQKAMDEFGALDILINNAGIISDKSFSKMDIDSWQRVLDVHLNGAYHVTKPGFAIMKERGYGRIVFTSSAAALFGNFGQTNYCSAKMGLIGFMNSLRLESEKYNIHVNTVAPLAKSQMTENLLPPEILDKMLPEYVAPIVLFLCSDEMKESGGIYNAGFGYFNKVMITSGKGCLIDSNKGNISPEDISANWDEISSMENSKGYKDIGGFILDLLGMIDK
ncbi:SDR family NAD(P)-dependent oxidoreductase [Desulforegula conservatrix]|uniref:SDR family NAD(P)-dependent oxidoreductase n=1 Tax=Desulforegula conservatrix TaxID=153026 RepID=UPI00040CD72D|nr:SDR family NAD(P)-dependent oxidoreductase [Desulforegula conservatrix]